MNQELPTPTTQESSATAAIAARLCSPAQRIACLWFPDWPIQRRIVCHPELRKQNVVLFLRDSRRGQIVAAVSPLARRSGVQAGMSLTEARSLLRAGSKNQPAGFHVLEHEPNVDTQALEALADSLEIFSPIVGLETFDELRPQKGRQPDCLLLDVTGLAHLFGDEQRLVQLMMQHCQQAGYLVRVAIADTLGMAWATAKYGTDAAQVLAVGDQSSCHPLPVTGLRLPTSIEEKLSLLGVVQIGQLLQLPRAELTMRFGNVIGQRLDQLLGVLAEPVIARRRPAEFEQSQWLEYATHHRETIEVVTERLVKSICQQMRSRQRGSLQWRITLGCVESDPIELTIRLFQATATVAHVMPLVAMQLEQALQPHTRESRKRRYTTIDVQEITVAVTSSALLAERQRRLFDENPRLDRQALAELINRLSGRLGCNNVVYPGLESDAQPEYAFRWQPLVGARRRRSPGTRKFSHLLARPLRLFHPPFRLQVVALSDSEESDGALPLDHPVSAPPALLVYQSSGASANQRPVHHKVVRHWGPERVETGWWRGRTVCRDYWRIETETGQHFWIFRDLRTRQWFLQGEF